MTTVAPAPQKLILVRHGETAWSVSGQHTGSSDIPLTDTGIAQARGLRQRLDGMAFTQVLTSPRQRARQTCELAGLGPTATVDPDLSEWDYGAYEGRTSLDIRRERPGWNIFRDGCPGGETPQEMSDRIDGVIARLAAGGGTIALFSHGHFGCVLAARWIGAPVATGQNFLLGTASLSIFGYAPRHPGVRVIELWNDAAIRQAPGR